MRLFYCASYCAPMLTVYRLKSVLNEFFRCEYYSLKTCPSCNCKTESAESSLLLQVNFNSGAPLEHILRNVNFGLDMKPNRLCEACSIHSDTDSVCRLASRPDILVIHLARINMSGSGSRKINAVIPFNEELDLSRFTKGKFLLKYRLLSVVQHRGTEEKGHYITIARAPSGLWMKLDDEGASPATGTDPFGQRAGDDGGDEGPFTPYVLFWAKVDQNEITEPPTKVHTALTSADVDDELQPVQNFINGVPQPPSKIHFVEKSKLAKHKQQHQKDENENGLRSLQISINGIQQPPSAKHSVKKSFSAVLSQQDVEEIYTHMSKILLASEMREMCEEQKNELEKIKTLSINGEVEEDGKKKGSPGKKDGKDGKEDKNEEEDRDEKQEKQEKHDGEEEKEGEQQQDEQGQGEQERGQQHQEKHEEKTHTEEKKHKKVSSNKRQRPDDHSTPDSKLEKFSRRLKSPKKSNSSQNTKPKGGSEKQTPSDDETSKNLEPKRAQVGKKRRNKKKKKKNRCGI